MICGRRAVRLKSACTRGSALAGRVDGRAATACSCGAESPSPVFVVARFCVSSFSRGRVTPSFFLGRSLAPLVCKKGRVCIRLNRHGNYDYVLRDRPLRPKERVHLGGRVLVFRNRARRLGLAVRPRRAEQKPRRLGSLAVPPEVRGPLEADQARLDREIDALRRGITAKTSELCTLDPSVADGSNIHEAFANLRDDG